MSKQTLSLSLSNSHTTDPYWLRMEIKEDEIDDGMSVAEAAAVIDAAYNIKPCEQQASNNIWNQGEGANNNNDIWQGVEDSTGVDAETVAAKKRFAERLTTEGYTEDCTHGLSVAELIPYDVTVQIYRSHRNELYKLQVTDGTASGATRYSERTMMVLDVENQSAVTLDKPIIGRPVVSWQSGNGSPKITITGNTLSWDGVVTGTLRAEFDTEWDEVTVHVTGDLTDSAMITGTTLPPYGTGWYSGTETGEEIKDYQDIQCSVLAFYHYQYEEITLNRPEPDESTSDVDKLNFCHFITTTNDTETDDGEGGDDDENRPECRRYVSEEIHCECDGKTESNDYYEVVPCPDGIGSGGMLDDVKRVIYKDCGYRDKVNDPAFYEATCCKPWPFKGMSKDRPMPHCETIVKGFANLPPDDDEEKIEDKYPKGTRFVSVAPADGSCGEWTINQKIVQKRCCDDVPALLWDYEESADIVTPESSATVSVKGGKSPIDWQVRGTGFYTNSARTQRDATTVGQSLTIFTDEDACGACVIYATDGCSSVSGDLKSTQGQWENIDPYSIPSLRFDADSATDYVGCTVPPTAIKAFAETSKYRVTSSYGIYLEGEHFHGEPGDLQSDGSRLSLIADGHNASEYPEHIKRESVLEKIALFKPAGVPGCHSATASTTFSGTSRTAISRYGGFFVMGIAIVKHYPWSGAGAVEKWTC